MLLQSAQVCSADLTFVDLDSKEIITLGGSDLIIAETNITFSTQQLRENRHYNITVTAANIAGTDVSQARISKYSLILLAKWC